MTDTVGKRLNKARLARGLSVDEAAHATRMRPDKIVALENDDYSRFGNNVYAKGFLLIYSRLLGVDATEEARFLDAPHSIRVRDYQYLSNAPTPPPQRQPSRIAQRLTSRQPSRPSALPLVLFVAVIFAVALFFYIRSNVQRLEPKPIPTPVILTPPTPQPPDASATPSTAPLAITGATPALSGETPVPPPPTDQTTTPEGLPVEVRRAQPATDTLPPNAAEITITVKKKTLVRICKDDPKSRPVFDDYLYPKTGPLSFKGSRIFITTREPANLEVKKNGVAVPFESGQPIQ